MLELKDEQIAEFYYRSYTAVDGLWFMKVEEKHGFDTALETDGKVWQVMPKIQARILKSIGKMEKGMEALFECFTTKLALDGFKFKTEKADDENSFRIIIDRCPWYDLIIKSKRENLAGKVGALICNTEYAAWAAEFDDNARFELQCQLCKGAESCILQFSR